MARVLGVTLDYLADDDQDEPPAKMDEWEAKLLEAARELGPKLAWRRLLGAPESALDRAVGIDAVGDISPPARRGSAGTFQKPGRPGQFAGVDGGPDYRGGLTPVQGDADSERTPRPGDRRVGGGDAGPDADASSRRGSA